MDRVPAFRSETGMHGGLARPASRRPRPDTRVCSQCEGREFNMCRDLDAVELAQVKAISTPLHLDAGATLIEEAAPADHAFNLTHGVAKAFKLLPDGRCQVTGFFTAGDFIGLSRDGLYPYSVVALTPLSLCRFERPRLRPLLDECPKLGRQLLRMMTDDLLIAQDQMLLLGRRTARERVICFLLMQSDRAVRQHRPADLIDLPMTRGDIGDYLGLTIETVSRTITQLKGEGLIALKGHHALAILEMDRLMEESGRDMGLGDPVV
ncbi:Crp/Fnr family transcriptional regulator [Oleomonas cavernae]|nr:Crp/Fnr family transcriptional regulator [Oleomonas cavernae]